MSTPPEPEALDEGRRLFSESTIRDLGHACPIGVPEGKPPILAKDFDFRSFSMEEELELDKVRSKKGGPGDHPGKVVEHVMAYMLTKWGGDSQFAQKSEKHRLQAIRSAYMTDVLYAYVCLRVDAMGPVLALQVTCPKTNCQHQWNWRTDLEELEVQVADRVEQVDAIPYKLRKPLPYGESKYDSLLLSPPTWGALSGVSQRGGTGSIKARLIQSCARKAFSEANPELPEIYPGESLLRKMHKRDVEEIASFLDSSFPSVDLTAEIQCPACDTEFTHSIQWNWDFFFSSSSLPSDTRT